jgi:hypothetical protein
MTRKLFSFVAAALLVSTAAAADPLSRGVFDQNTMQGWKRTTGASTMLYGSLPLHPTKANNAGPALGIAITSPYRVNGAGVLLHTAAPKLMDLRLTAKDFNGGWTSALRFGSTQAWTYDPNAKPGERHHNLFDSGPSWVVVGLLGAVAIAGTFALTENGT